MYGIIFAACCALVTALAACAADLVADVMADVRVRKEMDARGDQAADARVH